MKKDNTNNIELVVFNYFIRVIKSKGRYLIFRRQVKNDGILKYLVKRINSGSNPFSNLSTISDIVSELASITDNMAKSNNKKGGINGLDRYERVTMAINHLLHFFMETANVSMKDMNNMGEEIYALSCNKLFGDSFEDLEAEQEEAKNSMINLGALKALMFNDYINDIQSGAINRHTTFNEYIKANIDRYSCAKNNISVKKVVDQERGCMLGQPLDEERDNMFTNAALNLSDDLDTLQPF